MGSQPPPLEKGFKVSVVQTKQIELKTTEMKQARRDEQILNRAPGIQKHEQQEELNFKSLIKDDKEIDTKFNMSDNPFIVLGDSLRKNLEDKYKDNFKSIIQSERGGRDFIFDFFACAKVLDWKDIKLAMDSIIKLIEEFYNILSSKQVNDYVDLFLIVFATYLELDPAEEQGEEPAESNPTKFSIFHESLIQFFKKSLRNKNDEMLLIFNNIFIEKIFEALNDRYYSDRVDYLCDLLYSLLDPTDDQQVNLFKLFKEKIKDEEILYQTFAVLHEKLKGLTDSLIDGCLFYILNGITHENPNIRFYSMQMLLKYSMANVNFVYNFKKVLTKLARRERDRENCLLIIEILCQILKNVNTKKKEKINEKPNNNDKPNSEAAQDKENLQNDINFVNELIAEIVNRYRGDDIFVLLFTKVIYDYLYDNSELYKILLSVLYNCKDEIFSFVFYDDNDIKDENIKMKYLHTIFRGDVNIEKLTNWDKSLLFKAFSMLINENQIKELTPKDYDFLKFLTSGGIDPTNSDIWKSNFNFANLIIQDIKYEDRASICLSILEAFVVCGPIQKYVFDEWYESLSKIFTEIINSGNITCKNIVVQQMDNWIKNTKINQIVRDDIRKLTEIIPKDNINNLSGINESNINPKDNSIVSEDNKNLSGMNMADLTNKNSPDEEQKG